MLIIEKLYQKDHMSDSEELVADFILTLGKQITKSSTRSIAEATYTSPATTVRLCKKLGFTGFDEFKIQYIKEIEYLDRQYGKLDANYPFHKTDNEVKTANKISQLYLDTVQDTLSILDYESLKMAVLLMKHCKSIHIFSYGTTLNIAESFREKMVKIGKQVYITTNLNYQLYEVNALIAGDIAIIISYSGETEKILMIAQTCKKKNIPMILITSYGENSLTQFANCKLVISTKESLFHNLGDYSTHVSVSLLLDILYSVYFQQDYDNHFQKKIEAAAEYESLRKSSNPIISDKIKES